MSGFDKFQVMEALKAKGWIEDADSGQYMLRPPRDLLDRLASVAMYVYDARDLQDLVDQPDTSAPVAP